MKNPISVKYRLSFAIDREENIVIWALHSFFKRCMRVQKETIFLDSNSFCEVFKKCYADVKLCHKKLRDCLINNSINYSEIILFL